MFTVIFWTVLMHIAERRPGVKTVAEIVPWIVMNRRELRIGDAMTPVIGKYCGGVPLRPGGDGRAMNRLTL